jgi:hypothetical protein
MRKGILGLVVSGLVLLATDIGAQRPTIREAAKQGDVRYHYTIEYDPVAVEKIVSETDTILIGKIDLARPYAIEGRNGPLHQLPSHSAAESETSKQPQPSSLEIRSLSNGGAVQCP